MRSVSKNFTAIIINMLDLEKPAKDKNCGKFLNGIQVMIEEVSVLSMNRRRGGFFKTTTWGESFYEGL